ncbi:MAG TPA: serine/threonine-protein kinase [Polyangia bacterium]
MTDPTAHDPGLMDTAAPVSAGPHPGTRVGEYDIERELGRGGMGAVFAAHHPVIGKRVAIKVLDAYFSRDMALVRRFLDEARAVNKIGHPNIIDVFSFGQLPDGRQYFVMEYLEGETMADWLLRGRPDPQEARRLLLQVCEALEAAHREGIIHRDLKPENLWIARPKHGEPFMKVLDFGIAKLVAEQDTVNVTKTGTIMGTPQFMSPEQCTGRGVDHRTDIYALGVIIFRIYCGRLPFEGESVAELMTAQLTQPPPKPSEFAQLSPPLENLILSCLDKNPANRPVSAAELGIRLKEVAQVGGAITAVHAPMQRTGEAKTETRKGFAVDGEERSHGSNHRRNLLLALVAATVAGGALVAWLATRSGTPAAHPASATSPAAASAPAVAVPSAPAAPTVAAPAVAAPAVAAPAVTAPPPLTGEPAGPRKRPGLRSLRMGENTPKSNAVLPESTKSKPSRAARQGLIQENPF